MKDIFFKLNIYIYIYIYTYDIYIYIYIYIHIVLSICNGGYGIQLFSIKIAFYYT